MTAHSSKGVGITVTREDVAAIVRRVATKMHERQEAALKRQREAEHEYQYDTNEVIVCMVRRVSERRESALPRYIASTATMMGKAGIVSTQPDDDRFLESSMRMELARAWHRHGECKTFDDARERASKVRLIMERSFAHGSAANGGVR